MDLYSQLAALALSQCPSYPDVRIEAELDEGYSEVGLYCVNGTEEKHNPGFPPAVSAEFHHILDAIREEMGSSSGQKWSKCVFRTMPDGKFKFDVEYPD